MTIQGWPHLHGHIHHLSILRVERPTMYFPCRPCGGGEMGKITVENVNVPGHTAQVDAEKC